MENESQSMTNSVIKHNLMVEVDLLTKHCLKNNVEESTKYWYNHHKDQINTMVELLVEELELIKKLWDLGIDRLNETDIHRLSLDLTSSINKYCDGLFSTASYRVIIPCVLHIAYYRYRQKALHQSQYISEN